MSEKIYDKNSEILYLYDCKLCNPNGDPDDENKPRMDYETGRNLVSDVRLKRYIRDYLQLIGETIFVFNPDGFLDNAKTRMATILGIKNDKKISIDEVKAKELLGKTIDIRLFGAVIPDVTVKKGKKKINLTFTGPVQFNWGYSLNEISILESNSITSHFQTGKQSEEEKGMEKSAGAIGKDYRLYYSLIAFYGIVSGTRAEKTLFSYKDIKLLDESLVKAIPLTATTRSKNNQMPRLILRVEYKDKETFLGDLRRFVKLEPKEGVKEDAIRDITDFVLNTDALVDLLAKNKDSIEKIYLYQDSNLSVKGGGNLKEKLTAVVKDKIESIEVAS